jgi:hypothetical protein
MIFASVYSCSRESEQLRSNSTPLTGSYVPEKLHRDPFRVYQNYLEGRRRG